MFGNALVDMYAKCGSLTKPKKHSKTILIAMSSHGLQSFLGMLEKASSSRCGILEKARKVPEELHL